MAALSRQPRNFIKASPAPAKASPHQFLCKDYQQLEKAGRRLHFIKASPNGRFIKGKQMASPNDNFIKQVQWQFCQGQPDGHFIKAAILLMQIAISSKPMAILSKLIAIAVLSRPAIVTSSRPAPMAIL